VGLPWRGSACQYDCPGVGLHVSTTAPAWVCMSVRLPRRGSACQYDCPGVGLQVDTTALAWVCLGVGLHVDRYDCLYIVVSDHCCQPHLLTYKQAERCCKPRVRRRRWFHCQQASAETPLSRHCQHHQLSTRHFPPHPAAFSVTVSMDLQQTLSTTQCNYSQFNNNNYN